MSVLSAVLEISERVSGGYYVVPGMCDHVSSPLHLPNRQLT